MADALDNVEDVEVGVFRFGSRVERVSRISDIEHGCLMGRTATHLALESACGWLSATEADKRVAVVFTDGEPDDTDATQRAVTALYRARIKLLVGTMGLGFGECARSMPQSVIFDVDPSNAAPSLQTAIRRIARA